MKHQPIIIAVRNTSRKIFNMAAALECGCTGIRQCLLCEDKGKFKNTPINTFEEESTKRIRQYKLCILCGDTLPADELCSHNKATTHDYILLEGVIVVQDFLSELEEQNIVTEIDRTIWKSSQSGRRKQVKDAILIVKWVSPVI